MNHSYKLSILAVSLAAAFSATVAEAGQIQASSVAIARESITSDTQTITAPAIAYRFAGDVDARAQAQTFQVQFTVQSGVWAAAPLAQAISITDGVTGNVINQGAPVANTPTYSVTNIGLDPTSPANSATTVYATITVNQDAAGGLIKQPIISINASSNTIGGTANTVVPAASRGTLSKLFTVTGSLPADFAANGTCQAVKTLKVSFQHYVALSNPSALATTSNATADENTRSGATNVATLVTFPTNILPVIAASTGAAKVNPTAGSLTFNDGAGTTTLNNTFKSATLLDLGTVQLTQNAQGYDSDLTNQYSISKVAANGILGATTAAKVDGTVEASSLNVKVSANSGFVTGGSLWLSKATGVLGTECAAAIPNSTVAITAANAAGPITLSLDTAAINAGNLSATGNGLIHTCYSATGATAAIPQSTFSVTATLVKSAAGAGFNEQDNACSGPHFALTGGVKIDVRNYATPATAGNWTSVLRIINPSEVSTAKVYGQLIHADGSYGNWGVIAPALLPRAVLNITATNLNALLTSAPAAAAGTRTVGAAAPVANSNGAADRLRITAEGVGSLRVQNYLYNPDSKNFIEASGSQAVDFDGTADRAPASEGQYQSQDAQFGLYK
jgi:hypothetical protein